MFASCVTLNMNTMMKVYFGLFSVWLLMSGCTSQESSKNEIVTNRVEGDTCLVRALGMAFTKSLNQANQLATVEVDRLVLTSPAKSDYFNEPDGQVTYASAPVLLTQIDNTKPFTFQVKVTPTFTNTYDAGALYIYQNSAGWFKFAFEQDERKKTRMVTVRTIETSDDNNHDVVASAYAFMKISSDVKTIGFYYSIDGETWHLVRLFKNDYPKELWLGLSAQSPIGNGNSVVFENASLLPESVKDFRLGM